jgi:hypothetical protein
MFKQGESRGSRGKIRAPTKMAKCTLQKMTNSQTPTTTTHHTRKPHIHHSFPLTPLCSPRAPLTSPPSLPPPRSSFVDDDSTSPGCEAISCASQFVRKSSLGFWCHLKWQFLRLQLLEWHFCYSQTTPRSQLCHFWVTLSLRRDSQSGTKVPT